MQEIRILHLEEDPAFGDMVANLLRDQDSSQEQAQNFVVIRAATFPEFEKALEEGRFNLILSDHVVPGGNGMDALDFCRIHFPSVPFVFLSAKISADLAYRSLAHGASDYILKFDVTRIVPTILRALHANRESNALREAQARIRRDQANLRALIENTSNAVWSMDLDFGILVFNSSASLFAMKLSGQPMTVGSDFLQHLPQDDRERWRLAAIRVRNRERFREEHRVSWNGTDYTFDISFNPIFNDGLVTGMAVFGQDVTSAERSEAQAVPVVAEPMRILVVEDNPVNQLVLRSFLEKLGYSADLAANGLEALEAYKKAAYDLILMDCRMPVMDGFASARAIRQEEAETGEHAWIVAITADVTPGIHDRCLAAGMDGYISKPLPMAALKLALECATRDRKIRRASREATL